ncbi:MAG: hypothetical protein KKG75_00330 [Nanoarchaeota archaeon]|nr:hypothetical protein [Nanoarchaeota archaeon]
MIFEVLFSDKNKVKSLKNMTSLYLRSSKIEGKFPLIKMEYTHKELISKDFCYFEREGFCFGFIIKNVNDIEKDAKCCYGKILKKIDKNQPYRFWNFIPNINKETDKGEIYKLFNVGRKDAFRDKYGEEDFKKLPSATGIDILNDKLIIIFIAGKEKPKHLQNPNQISPYRYPKKYGVKPPSFSRATKLKSQDKEYFFISGTASIKGHSSMYRNKIDSQFRLTENNLNIMLNQGRINYKKVNFNSAIVYLRNKKDFKNIKEKFQKSFHKLKSVNFLLANICRKELDLEIEMAIIIDA